MGYGIPYIGRLSEFSVQFHNCSYQLRFDLHYWYIVKRNYQAPLNDVVRMMTLFEALDAANHRLSQDNASPSVRKHAIGFWYSQNSDNLRSLSVIIVFKRFKGETVESVARRKAQAATTEDP
jgi:hypothetical protein